MLGDGEGGGEGVAGAGVGDGAGGLAVGDTDGDTMIVPHDASIRLVTTSATRVHTGISVLAPPGLAGSPGRRVLREPGSPD